ncbi:MAG: discoidin domain-containing protein [Bryobacteraceae bacterium]
MFRLSLSFLAAVMALGAQRQTLGIGVYPGDPRQNFAPAFRVDATTYRNLALHRAAYQSSSYDYNLTAQLVTDGIVETRLPRWVTVSTSGQGVLPKHERENVLDHNWTTNVQLRGADVWVDIGFLGGNAAPEVDRVDVDASAPSSDNQEWSLILSGSEDGKAWRELRRTEGALRPTGEFKPSLALPAPVRSRYYRVELRCGRRLNWRVGEVAFFRGGRRLDLGGPYDFSSAWMSAGSGEEWVYVDLGASCTFDRVKLDWIRRAAEGSVEASDDAAHWRALAPLRAAKGNVDEIRLPQPAQARYVRLLMTRPASPEGYILSEMAVWGRGGPVPVAHPAAAIDAAGRLDLAGGRWRWRQPDAPPVPARRAPTLPFR